MSFSISRTLKTLLLRSHGLTWPPLHDCQAPTALGSSGDQRSCVSLLPTPPHSHPCLENDIHTEYLRISAPWAKYSCQLDLSLCPLSLLPALMTKAEPRPLQLTQPCQVTNPCGTAAMPCPQAWDSTFSSPQASSTSPLPPPRRRAVPTSTRGQAYKGQGAVTSLNTQTFTLG